MWKSRPAMSHEPRVSSQPWWRISHLPFQPWRSGHLLPASTHTYTHCLLLLLLLWERRHALKSQAGFPEENLVQTPSRSQHTPNADKLLFWCATPPECKWTLARPYANIAPLHIRLTSDHFGSLMLQLIKGAGYRLTTFFFTVMQRNRTWLNPKDLTFTICCRRPFPYLSRVWFSFRSVSAAPGEEIRTHWSTLIAQIYRETSEWMYLAFVLHQELVRNN